MTSKVSASRPAGTMSTEMSILHGPSSPPLVDLSLGALLDLQCRRYGSQECLVVPWTGARWTYHDLDQESKRLAKMLIDVGIQPGDRVAIMAGNCEQFVALLFAVARAGAILVVLNNTYTAFEAVRALRHTGSLITSQRRLDCTDLLQNRGFFLPQLLLGSSTTHHYWID